MKYLWTAVFFGLAACGAAYISPSVQEGVAAGTKVRVLPLTAETALAANQSGYRPTDLPRAFYAVAGATPQGPGAGAAPPTAFERQSRPAGIETRLPPPAAPGPYVIGVGDVLVLATPQAGSTVEELTGLLAAQNRRQGYTVQDDGAIAIPDVGRVNVAGLTLEQAEDQVFQALVANQIDPAFSLEVSEFNSMRVSIGGAVNTPGVAPVSLTPLYLDQALSQAGGVTVTDPDFATVRIYRDGSLYQLPLEQVYNRAGRERIRLIDGDSVFVDTAYDLDQAESYFAEQIRLAEFRQEARSQQLGQLQTEFSIRRAALQDQRQNFKDRVELGAEKRDYVYITGEVAQQDRFALPFGQQATLADVLFGSGGIPTRTGNPSQIYVLRGSPDPLDFATVTAYQLNAKNAGALLVSTRLEMRPNDVIFVAEQPITRWNRVLAQFIPSLITTAAAQAAN